MIKQLPIRAKLTLWYLLATFAAVVLFGLISCGVLYYALLKEKKTHLLGREERLVRLIEDNRAKNISMPLVPQLRNYALVTHEGNLFLLRREDGSVFFAAAPGNDRWQQVPAADGCRELHYAVLRLHNGLTMVQCHRIQLDGMALQLNVGSSLDEEMEILHSYLVALLFVLPVLLLLSSLCGYFLSRRAMGPVERLTRAALEIGIGELSARVPVPAPRDEVRQLAEAWNQLLERLEAAVNRLSQFSADVSHDLRTSITIMLATTELALQREQSEQESRETLKRIVEECCTAATLLDALLSVVRSKNFIHEASFERLDLNVLVLNSCRRVEDLAESKEVLLDWGLCADPVWIDGNALLLNRLLGIFLDNALKYTPAQGEIRAEVFVRNALPGIRVRDTGVGIALPQQEKIFERFYQADLRERQPRGGNGLGLSIARWIAEAHQATIRLESAPQAGSCFEILFPEPAERKVAAKEYAEPVQT
jgi:signal transduction histidine kinase